jgi:hypothetical protein
LEEAWNNARSIESLPEEENISRIGEIRKENRIYVLYQSTTGKYWYKTEIIIDGHRLTEAEAVFGKMIRRKAYHRRTYH